MANKLIAMTVAILIFSLGTIAGKTFNNPEVIITKEPIIQDVITEEGIIIYKDLDDDPDMDEIVVMDSRIEEIMDTKGMHIIFLKDIVDED